MLPTWGLLLILAIGVADVGGTVAMALWMTRQLRELRGAMAKLQDARPPAPAPPPTPAPPHRCHNGACPGNGRRRCHDLDCRRGGSR